MLERIIRNLMLKQTFVKMVETNIFQILMTTKVLFTRVARTEKEMLII